MSFPNLKILGFLILLSTFSCGGENLPNSNAPLGDDPTLYQQSRSAWLDLKELNGDSYKYTATETSWTGAGSHTTIEVRKGEVTGRSYEGFEISDETGEISVIESFGETGTDIGKDQRGFRPLTIDELYELCLSQYLVVDPEENRIFFETFENGIVSLCGYVPKNCADDCYQGFTLSDFKWL